MGFLSHLGETRSMGSPAWHPTAWDSGLLWGHEEARTWPGQGLWPQTREWSIVAVGSGRAPVAALAVAQRPGL